MSRRANINLAIGVVTTILAVFLLLFTVVQPPSNAKDWTVVLASYAPRLGVAVFVEVFSFFFLRLYRSNLDQIRYFQDELTMLDQRKIALSMTRESGSEESRSIVVRSLANYSPQTASQEQGSVSPKELVELLERIVKLSQKKVSS